jgi:hypothetical protein
MTRKVILHIFASLLLLPIVACNNGPKEPSRAEKERQEKEYQKTVEQMRQMTEGNKDVLDGKKPPKKQPTPVMPPPGDGRK